MPTNGITDPIISTSWYSSPYRNFCLQLLKTKLKLWAHDEIFLGWSMFFVLGKQVHPVPSERLIGSSKGWETRGVIPLIPYETQVLLSKHSHIPYEQGSPKEPTKELHNRESGKRAK